MKTNKEGVFTENEIRPDKYAKQQARVYHSDVKRLLQQKKEFVKVNCPACAGKDYRISFKKYTLEYVVCGKCETVFLNPRPAPKTLKDFYLNSKNYRFWDKYIFPASEKARRKNIFKPRAELVKELVERYSTKRNILLDIGAGFGTFCEEIGKLSFVKEVVAVEPNPNLAATCREKGIKTMEQFVEDICLERPVDIVTSFEMIEHLFSPRDFILQCVSALSKNGILILTTPNVKGFDILTLRELSGAIDTEHLNYFHPRSLCHLLKRCGLEVLEVLTPGRLDAELVRKKILAREFDISPHPFLKQVLIEDWERVGSQFQRFLSDNLLSSHMLIVAKKTETEIKK